MIFGFVTLPQRPAPDALSRPAYRPEIDGLRAIAVLLVILFHAGFRVPGGYVGVDVFFVISGYLITTLLLHRAAGSRLSLTLFWAGRIRRIVPALAVVLAASLIPALLLLTPSELEEFAKSVGASAIMGANIFFWRSGGYFERPESHLLHLWTIGIEEQFYLFYPIFLLAVLKWRPWLLTPLLYLGLALSLGASEFLNNLKPHATYLLLPTRGWELLVGAVVARFEMAFPGRASQSLPGAAPAGLALVVGSAFLYDVNTPFPGLWALAPTLGTALLLLYARTSLAGRLLSWAPLVGIGLVSYGAYLWHQPLLSFSRVALQREASVAEALLLVLLSLTLGYLSWRFVEMPLRRRPLRPRRMFAFFAAVIAASMAFLALVLLTDGLRGRFGPSALRYADIFPAFMREYDERYGSCLGATKDVGELDVRRLCRLGAPGGAEEIALVGDSHAYAIAPAVEAVARRRGLRAVMFIRFGCPPVLREEGLPSSHRECPRFTLLAVEHILSRPELSTVVLSARWSYYLEGTWFDNAEGGIEPGAPEPRSQSERTALVQSIREAVLMLVRGGKRVVLVYPIPEAGWNVPHRLFRAELLGTVPDSSSTAYERFVLRNAGAYRMLNSLGRHRNIAGVYPADRLCNAFSAGRCLLGLGGQPFYFDDDHLTREGALFALPGLEPAMFP